MASTTRPLNLHQTCSTRPLRSFAHRISRIHCDCSLRATRRLSYTKPKVEVAQEVARNPAPPKRHPSERPFVATAHVRRTGSSGRPSVHDARVLPRPRAARGDQRTPPTGRPPDEQCSAVSRVGVVRSIVLAHGQARLDRVRPAHREAVLDRIAPRAVIKARDRARDVQHRTIDGGAYGGRAVSL